MEYCALGSLRDLIDISRPLTGAPIPNKPPSLQSPALSGSLTSLVLMCHDSLAESEVAVVCFHTLKALIYLHSRNIIHRDVKAANILLNDQAQVKIGTARCSDPRLCRSWQQDTIGCTALTLPLVWR